MSAADPMAAALRTAARRIRAQRAHDGAERQTFDRYRDDPVGFCREVLGLEPWSRQADLLSAVAHHTRVLCRSGHKVGKSTSCASLALWWVATRPGGRVVMTAPTGHQVKSILWRELRARYGAVREPLGGAPLPLDPATGLHLPDGGEIFGISTKDPEALAGISAPELLFIVDEASGFPDALYEAIKGNAAGGATIVGISNPTRTAGWFFKGLRTGTYDLDQEGAFAPGRWRLLHISSEESPNIVGGAANDGAIAGLATADWLEEMRAECGPDYDEDPMYLVRVRGEPPQSADSVLGLALVDGARARWQPDADPDRPLCIGVDVARFGDDETVIQPVRGAHAYRPTVAKRADGPEVAAKVAEVLRELRREGEQVRINVDGIGVGASVVDALRQRDEHRRLGWFYVADINVGEAGDDDDHVNLRAQLWFGVRDWLREGGTLCPDELLRDELLAPTYLFDARGRKQIVSKKEMRQALGRSPDRADALALALYRGRSGAVGYQAAAPREADDAGTLGPSRGRERVRRGRALY